VLCGALCCIATWEMMPMTARLIAIAAALSLGAEGWAQLEDQPNLCPNPGFEAVDDAGWAEGWTIWPEALDEGASVAIDDQVAHSGERSLRISHEGDRAYSRAQRRIEVTPGVSYLFTFFVRTQDVEPATGAMGARLYIEKSSGDRASTRQQGTMPWTPIRVGPIEVGDASFVTLMCYLHQSSGTVWFDDISVLEVTEAVAQSLAQQQMQARFASDVTVVRTMAVEADDQAALTQLNALQERAWGSELETDVDYRAGPPWFPMHAELFRIAAQVNARRLPGAGPVAAWADDPFAAFPVAQLVPAERDAAAEVVMCREERDQALVKLCTLANEPMPVRVVIAPPAGDAAPALTVREVTCIDPGLGGQMYGDPLPLLDLPDGRATMTLAPGVVRGVWLQIDSAGAAPGDYRAALTITPAAGAPVVREVNIRVLPIAMPAEKPVVTWNYSYENYWIMPERWEQARRDLVEHHINGYCWPHPYLPWPVPGEDGALRPLDWSRFDAGLQSHDNIQWLLLWPGFEWGNNLALRLELEPGSAEWRTRFVEWFTALRAGLAERGFGPDRVAWYLADEPCNLTRATAVQLTGEVIREIAPDAYVLANPYGAATQELLEMMDPVVNLWCPSLSMLDDEHLEFFRAGTEVFWSYQVLPKTCDPFAVYRLSFWRCHDMGITGQGFWCYADAQGSNWDAYDHERAEYAPIYDGDPRELIPGRRWEAWREGVEDYTLLWMLDEAAGGELTEAQQQAVARAWAAVETALAERTPAAVATARGVVLQALAATAAD